jgi:hypothetical protein
VQQITPKLVENLYSPDLAYLQELYNQLNRVDAGPAVTCPQCAHSFKQDGASLGG